MAIKRMQLCASIKEKSIVRSHAVLKITQDNTIQIVHDDDKITVLFYSKRDDRFVKQFVGSLDQVGDVGFQCLTDLITSIAISSPSPRAFSQGT